VSTYWRAAEVEQFCQAERVRLSFEVSRTFASFAVCVAISALRIPPRTAGVLPLAYNAPMQTSTQVYRQLKAAEFSEPQAKTLVEILQAAGIVEPEPPESELSRIEQYLLARPFQPFVIQMAGGKTYGVERLEQCRFTRHGSVCLRDIDGIGWAVLSSDHIVRVQKV
jgi:hypothetical protein